MKKALLIIIGIGVCVQFGVLVSMLVKRELTLRHGEVFRFHTAPVDPFDAFRGRYVALSFDIERERLGTLDTWQLQDNKPCYVQLGTDTNGFATVVRGTECHVAAVFRDNPGNLPVIKARIEKRWIGQGYHHTIKLPFDRFYMPEKLAPEAERVYLEATRGRDRTQSAAAVVRVWRGNAVIEDLEINGVPIVEYLRQAGGN